MAPYLFIDNKEILPIRLGDPNLAHVAEISDRRFWRIRNGKNQKPREKANRLHALGGFPSALPCSSFLAES